MVYLFVYLQKKILSAGVDKLESDSDVMKQETASLVQSMGNPEKQKLTAGMCLLYLSYLL